MQWVAGSNPAARTILEIQQKEENEMSYCLKICRCVNGNRTDDVVELPEGHKIFGPNVKLFSGETRAQLSVTTNYYPIYAKLAGFGANLSDKQDGPGIKVIDGYPLEWAIKSVANAINNIHTNYPDCVYDPDADYWEETPANARKALENFLEICHMCVKHFPDEWNKYVPAEGSYRFNGFYVKVEY